MSDIDQLYESDESDNESDTGSIAGSVISEKNIEVINDIDGEEEEEEVKEEETDELDLEGGDDYYDDIEGGATTDDEEDDEDEIDEESQTTNLKSSKLKSSKAPTPRRVVPESADSDEDDENDDENYLQKFDNEINKSYISEFHSECLVNNYEEIELLCNIIRDNNNIIIDPLHKTIPILTKYEKTRIIGQRAKQIESGAKPFVKVPENIIDSYIIAGFELEQKKIPFIIRRPIPGGAFEYWKIKDLENIAF